VGVDAAIGSQVQGTRTSFLQPAPTDDLASPATCTRRQSRPKDATYGASRFRALTDPSGALAEVVPLRWTPRARFKTALSVERCLPSLEERRGSVGPVLRPGHSIAGACQRLVGTDMRERSVEGPPPIASC
jgi:hypothetical protein